MKHTAFEKKCFNCSTNLHPCIPTNYMNICGSHRKLKTSCRHEDRRPAKKNQIQICTNINTIYKNETWVLPPYTSSSQEICWCNFLCWRISRLQASHVYWEYHNDWTYPWDRRSCPIAPWISRRIHHSQHCRKKKSKNNNKTTILNSQTQLQFHQT